MTPDKLRPVFVIGSYRSGTTVTGWCIGQHPNIWILPETYWIAEFASRVPELYRHGTAQPRAHLARCDIGEDDFRLAAVDFVDAIVRAGQERRIRGQLADMMDGKGEPPMRLSRSATEPKQRWVDHTPENSHHVDALLYLFPGARFVHMVRNPHEVARSLMRFDKAGGARHDARQAYEAWLRLANASYDAEQRLGPQFVRRFLYEDLVSQPDTTMRDIMEFVGQDFVPACLDPLRTRIHSSGGDAADLPSLHATEVGLKPLVMEAEQLFDRLRRHR